MDSESCTEPNARSLVGLATSPLATVLPLQDFPVKVRCGYSHIVTLHDRDKAVLGSLTEIGSGGTLSAPNGILLEEGKVLVGQGTVHTDSDEFKNEAWSRAMVLASPSIIWLPAKAALAEM